MLSSYLLSRSICYQVSTLRGPALETLRCVTAIAEATYTGAHEESPSLHPSAQAALSTVICKLHSYMGFRQALADVCPSLPNQVQFQQRHQAHWIKYILLVRASVVPQPCLYLARAGVITFLRGILDVPQ